MQNPLFVVKSYELINIPKKELKPIQYKLSNIVWIIVTVLIVGSFVFKENMFSSLSWVSRVLLVLLAISVSYHGGYKKTKSQFEIWFYDDRLVFYRPKRYYNYKVTRREYNTFYYEDISKIIYRTGTHRINIEGRFLAQWYNYDLKSGEVLNTPKKNKKIDSLVWLYPDTTDNIDYVSIFEHYTTHSVEIQEG